MTKTASLLAVAALLGSAAALLGSAAALAEETTPVAQPAYAPFAYAPVALDQEQLKAYVEAQQKAYAQFLAYQQQVDANTPAFLRIPPIPQRPEFNTGPIQDIAAENQQMFEQLQREHAEREQALRQSFSNPIPNIEQAFAERENTLNAALDGIQARLTERQKSLDAADKPAQAAPEKAL